MTFQAICPFCKGTGGGSKSFTVGLSAVEALKQFNDNYERRCGTCRGRGYVTVQLAEESVDQTSVTFGQAFPTDRRCVKSGNLCGTDTHAVGSPCGCPQCCLWMHESLLHSLHRSHVPKRPAWWGDGDYQVHHDGKYGRLVSWYVITPQATILGPLQEEEAKWWKDFLSIVLPPSNVQGSTHDQTRA